MAKTVEGHKKINVYFEVAFIFISGIAGIALAILAMYKIY